MGHVRPRRPYVGSLALRLFGAKNIEHSREDSQRDHVDKSCVVKWKGDRREKTKSNSVTRSALVRGRPPLPLRFPLLNANVSQKERVSFFRHFALSFLLFYYNRSTAFWTPRLSSVVRLLYVGYLIVRNSRWERKEHFVPVSYEFSLDPALRNGDRHQISHADQPMQFIPAPWTRARWISYGLYII